MSEETPAVAASPLTLEMVTEIVNKSVAGLASKQEKQFGSKFQSLNELIDGLKPKETPAAATDTTTTANNTAVDPRMSVLERQLKELQEQNKVALDKAAKADRENALSAVLASTQWASESARKIAFKEFASEMKDLGNGEYAIGDQPLAEGIKSRLNDMKFLLDTRKVGGSGASVNNGNESSPQAGQLTMEEIKAAKTPEQLQKISQRLAQIHK